MAVRSGAQNGDQPGWGRPAFASVWLDRQWYDRDQPHPGNTPPSRAVPPPDKPAQSDFFSRMANLICKGYTEGQQRPCSKVDFRTCVQKEDVHAQTEASTSRNRAGEDPDRTHTSFSCRFPRLRPLKARNQQVCLDFGWCVRSEPRQSSNV